jgi:hypothetical protein
LLAVAVVVVPLKMEAAVALVDIELLLAHQAVVHLLKTH